MIIDLNEPRSAVRRAYDLCIVGSGPAGMTVANELAESGVAICVLESGRLKTTRHADKLRDVRVAGYAIKDYSRERVLGGASTTWAGLSSPLDPIDLAPRPFLGEGASWPLTRLDLDPYYEGAAARYRFPRLAMFGEGGLSEVKKLDERPLSWVDVEEKVFVARSEPQNFGKEYRKIFERENVDLYLDATVLELESGGGPDVRSARVRTERGDDHSVMAKVFVLATGGIENARLLLKSTSICAAGLGNEHDQVGRYLMNHPKNYFGIVELQRPVTELPYYFGSLYRGFAGYAGLRFTQEQQRSRRLLNSYVRFEPIFPWSDSRGVEALVLLAKRSSGLFRRWKESRSDHVTSLRDYSETGDDSDLQNRRRGFFGWVGLLGLIVANLPTVGRYAYFRLFEGARPKIKSIRLRNFIEMEPLPTNRVELSEERDVYGERLPLVTYGCSDLDRRSLIELHATLREEFARNDLGRLTGDLAQADPWPIDEDASHHLGTARMGTDPRVSVVNPDCRLHSVGNVYVAGGAVFPTSGCANPTFTIVALSIRLAEEIGKTHFSVRSRAAESSVPIQSAGPTGSNASGETMDRRRVIVVGAGGRVVDTALPALRSLEKRLVVDRVYARTERTLTVGGIDVATRSLDRIEEDGVAAGDLIYVAVSKGNVAEVLQRLARLDGVGDVDLLIDTPVLPFKHLKHVDLFDRFRRVDVAEDCATLPYLELVRSAFGDGPLGKLREVALFQSGYRYHAFATLKTLFGSPIERARRAGVGKHSWCHLQFGSGSVGRMLEPRDYRAGRMLFIGEKGSVSDYPLSVETNHELAPWIEEGAWRGFRLGDEGALGSVELSVEERSLLSDVDEPIGITSRMEDMKRVGFRRLVERILDGEVGYRLNEGLDDMAIDYLLDKVGRYRPSPLWSVKSTLGKRLLKRVTGLSRG